MRSSPTLLWALRTALSTSLLSLALHARLFPSPLLTPTAFFFAALTSAFCSAPSLGATLRAGAQVAVGSAFGAALAAAALSAATAPRTTQWAALALASPLILVLPTPLLTTKLAWGVYLAAVIQAGESEGGLAGTGAILVGALVGVAGAAAGALLCATRAGAGARAAQVAQVAALCAAARAAAAALGAPKRKRAALARAAAAHAARGAAAREQQLALAPEAGWELGWGGGAAAAAAALPKSSAASTLALAAEGLVLALIAAAEGDAALADAGARASAGAGMVGGVEACTTLRGEARAAAAAGAAAVALDVALAPPALALVDAVAALVGAAAAGGAAGCAGCKGEGAAPGGAAPAAGALHAALKALDDALFRARAAVFYAPSPTPEADGDAQVALALHGVPAGRHLFVYSLRTLSAGALALAGLEAGCGVPAVSTAACVEAVEVQPVVISASATAADAPRPPQPPGAPLAHSLATLLPPARLAYALRLTCAALVSVALGEALLGSGAWAATAVAFVAPRQDITAGGSLHAAFLRVAGTLAGAAVGLAAVVAAGGVGVWAPTLLIGAWVWAAGMARGSPRHAYGAAVAQFTPFLLLDTPPGDATAWALARVAQNVLGVAVFGALEVFFWPARVASEQRRSLGAALSAAVLGVGAVEASVLGKAAGDGGAGGVGVAVAALRAACGRQAALLREAEAEPDWTPLSLGAIPALPEAPCRAALRACEEAAVLLSLLGGLASALGGGGGAARLVAPCAQPLQRLLRALGGRYGALGDAVAVTAGAGVGGARGSGGALEGEGRAMDDALRGVFLGLVRGARDAGEPVVANEALVAFVALSFGVRALVRNAEALGEAVRGVNGGSGDLKGGSEGEEGEEAGLVTV